MIIPRGFSPITNGVPVHLERRIGFRSGLKTRLRTGNVQEAFEPVRIELLHGLPFRHLVLTELLCGARLQTALDCLAEKVVRGGPTPAMQQGLRVGNARFSENLQVRPVHRRFAPHLSCGLSPT